MNCSVNTTVRRYFLAVMLLSAPFWLVGALLSWEPFPGIPVSAAMAVVPGLVAIVLVTRVAGGSGAIQWLKSALAPSIPGHRLWVLVALLVPPTIMFATYIVMRISGYNMPKPELDIVQLTFLLLIFLVPALLEEIGWSGYALDRLQQQMSALVASLLIGVIWATWHFFPLLQIGRTIGWIAWWSVGTVAIRILITWIFNNSGQSCLAAALFHASQNASWQAFPNHGSHYDPAIHGLVLVVASGTIVVKYGGKTLVSGQ